MAASCFFRPYGRGVAGKTPADQKTHGRGIFAATLLTQSFLWCRQIRLFFYTTEHDMAGHGIPHFQNDGGHAVIEVGVKEFMCTGASVPFDHPHIYIDMGDDNEKVCSYCSTLYRYNAKLHADQTVPDGCTFNAKAA
jgi:uncharacterized Zn-finger protein